MMASSEEPQSLLIVVAGTRSGKPASSAAMRATLRLSSPAWFAQPIITSSIRSGSTPARATASLMTRPAISSGRTSFNAPPYLPNGVRHAEIIYALLIRVLDGVAGEDRPIFIGFSFCDDLVHCGSDTGHSSKLDIAFFCRFDHQSGI